MAPTPAFSKGAPIIFRKHMPLGMGTESLGMIRCIFAKNGPLESGIESSFSGTGWDAKGDFIRFSYLYQYIFESKTHTLFEITCPELYAQQSRNDQMHIRGEMTSGKWTLSGFVRSRPESLWWFGVDFSKGAPTIFRKHISSGMSTESLGMIRCIFAENGPIEGGIESSFSVPAGVLRVISYVILTYTRTFSNRAPFSVSTCPQVWAQKVWEWLDVYSQRMGP